MRSSHARSLTDRILAAAGTMGGLLAAAEAAEAMHEALGALEAGDQDRALAILGARRPMSSDVAHAIFELRETLDELADEAEGLEADVSFELLGEVGQLGQHERLVERFGAFPFRSSGP